MILLPVVLHFLPSDELGLWYVFLSIGTFVSLFDFGFTPQMARQITYSFSGALSLQKKQEYLTTFFQKILIIRSFRI